MHKHNKLIALIALLIVWSLKAASAPGGDNTMQGKNVLIVDGREIVLSHAYAHLHDNAEGLLDFPKELRILLVDREIAPDALNGLVFLPVTDMAKNGNLQGLLLTLDPNDLSKVLITVLTQPNDPQAMLMTITRSSSEKDIIRNFTMSGGTVSGQIEDMDTSNTTESDMQKINYSVQFSAPVVPEPAVTADQKGKDIKTSPLVKVLHDCARALTKGDFDLLKRNCTAMSNKHFETYLSNPEFKSYAKQAGAEKEKMIASIKRIVVRGNRAVVIYKDKSFENFAQENGAWKKDD